jgi:hypothetical protein
MKTNRGKDSLTLGRFITAANEAWGERRARGIVWLAVNARLIEFQGPNRFSFFEAEPQAKLPLDSKFSPRLRVASCSTRPARAIIKKPLID